MPQGQYQFVRSDALVHQAEMRREEVQLRATGRRRAAEAGVVCVPLVGRARARFCPVFGGARCSQNVMANPYGIPFLSMLEFPQPYHHRP